MSKTRTIGLAMFAVMTMGCAKIATNKVRTAEPDPSRSPNVESEKKLGDVTAEAAGEDEAIEIKVTRPVMCREVTYTPQLGAETTVREFQPPWGTGQWVLGIGGLALGGAGAGFFAKSQHDDATKKTQDVETGGILIGLGAVSLVMVLVNGVRAMDSTEEVPAEPTKVPSQWKQCGTKPAAGQKVEVVLSDGTKISGKTDETGAARLGLEGILPNKKLVAAPQAMVLLGGKNVDTVNLHESAIYARWVQVVEDEKTVKEAGLVAAQAVAVQKQHREAEEQRQAEAAMVKKTASWTKESRSQFYHEFMDFFNTGARIGEVKGDPTLSLLSLTALPSCTTTVLMGALATMSNKETRRGAAKAQSALFDECLKSIQAHSPNDVFCLPDADECRVSPRLIIYFKAADLAKPAIEQAERTQCVRKCLASAVNATRDHCEAVCQ